VIDAYKKLYGYWNFCYVTYVTADHNQKSLT